MVFKYYSVSGKICLIFKESWVKVGNLVRTLWQKMVNFSASFLSKFDFPDVDEINDAIYHRIDLLMKGSAFMFINDELSDAFSAV